MKTVKKLMATALVAVSATVASLAAEVVEETSFGIISGQVTDTERHTLPGATIQIESLHTGVTADINGFYKLPNIKPGTYTLKVSYVGYTPIYKKVNVTNSNKVIVTDIVMSEGLELQEVSVKGAFAGQRKALQMQKSAMGVTNVVSADQIGKFPDSNIGDALKRINGINVQYDQGEARFGQVRGTSADLTSVTVNGNRLPSAEGDTRNVQLDLIPADMVQTIEVSKVVTSDMDGDAIGGSINLVTKNTPYRRVLNFTGSTGYTWISGKPQWNIGGTWGDRFFGNKLGVMASASYQYAPGGSDNTEFEYVEKKGEIQLKEAQVRQYYVTRERQSYSLALDYQFNPLHKISFKGIYNRRNDWENRYRISYKKLNSDAKDQSIVLQTKAGADDTKGARLERQQTMDFTLDGEHNFGNLKLDWTSSYSRATEDRPNERYIGLKLKGNSDMNFGESFVDIGMRQPYSTLSIPAFDEAKWKLDELCNSDQSIKENEIKERINFTLPLSKGLYGNSLKFGYKYTRKDKERNTEYYDYTDAEDKYIPDWKTNITYKIRDGFMSGSQYPIGTQFVSKDYMGGIDFNKADGAEVLEEEAGNYEATEQIHAGYLRLDQKLGKRLDATIGLRIENTRLNTSGVNYIMDENDNESLKPTGEYKSNYTNLLPSLLLRYKTGDDGSVRASLTKTMSRPKYSALVANKRFNIADQEATIGDPNIKPTTAWNFDLSIDHYFKSIGMVSLGLFYKDMKNVNIETLGYYTGEELGLTGNEEMFEVTQNMNAYDARVYGVEAAYQRDFGFIAPSLRCLGFYGNYTYTHTTTRNYNPRLGIDNGDDIRMAGSPEHTANASLYFEKGGVNIRLSYNFASSFIDQMNTGSRELDRYYDKVSYLDLNASYTWGKQTKFTVFAEANNLLNQPLRYYQGTKDRTMQTEYYGVKVNAGFKINL
ncbi:MAG: TonB-dependent receptor [Prevotella sp.]|nr:TonB-dependent receptor [Prevotella sp.]